LFGFGHVTAEVAGALARTGAWRLLHLDRSSASPPPRPSPIEGEGVTGCPLARLVTLGSALGKLTLQIGYELFGSG
jgi:hypothetical protein